MIYVKIEGKKKIEGDVTAKGYEKHIAFDSFQAGVGRGIHMKGGRQANREVSTPSFSEVNLTKVVDGASADLLAASYGEATEGMKVVIKFVKTGAGEAETYMCYTLEDALVSAYSVSCAGEGEATESLTLSYSKIEVEFTRRDANNKLLSPGRTGYCLATQQKM